MQESFDMRNSPQYDHFRRIGTNFCRKSFMQCKTAP